jgi:GT2 family glycosyltransferase
VGDLGFSGVPQPVDISVVIATRDRPERLLRQLAALRRQTVSSARFEVVVVDDGSSRPTAELLGAEETRREQGQLRVIRNDVPAGPGAARNVGWKAAHGRLIAFTDDDCEVAADWLEAYLEAALRHPGAILQGRVLPHPDEIDDFGPFSHTVRIEKPTRGFETANILYPRAMLEQLGGFDAAAFTKAGGEDTDLAWKALERGAERVWVPEALAHHAVLQLGPLGMLRRATIWDESVLAYKRHAGLRRTLVMGVFWNREHFIAARALLALVLPARLRWIRWWLAAPYMVRLVDRRSGPLLAPFIITRDLVEIASLLRGSMRYRTLVI